PYGIRPRTMRIHDEQAKGYHQSDMLEAFRRYIPKSEIDRIHEEFETNKKEQEITTASAEERAERTDQVEKI
ncbi:MAG: hypothetical protein JWO95_1495, partial [Verrucomicrobiales bacterium]|nr:hypothetical protein [Verrucomicrobiales bacterium]